jgi:hypothetical protein
MTLFDRAARAAHRVHLRVGGESVLLVGRRKSSLNAGLAEDPARVGAALTAVFSEMPADLSVSDSYDPRTDQRVGLATSVMTAVLAAADVPWTLREGDRVDRLDTAQMYSVSKIHRDGAGHLTLTLQEI